MKITKIIPLAVSVAALLMVSGCSNNFAPNSEGSVFDGAIKNATVCIDTNGNDKCDTSEPSTTTDLYGNFVLNSNGFTGPLVMVGGTDTGTGELFTGTMTAPAGSTAVSPLTSAIQALIKDGSSAADAETIIKTTLGIDPTVKLTTFNPFTATENDAGKVKSVLAAQSQLQVIVHAVSTTVAKAGATEIKDSMASAMKEVAKGLKAANATSAVAVNTATLTSIASTAVTNTANTVYASNPVAKVAAQLVAADSATVAVAQADYTKTKITNSTSAANAVSESNTGITTANTTMQTTLTTASVNVAAAVKAANVTDLTTAQTTTTITTVTTTVTTDAAAAATTDLDTAYATAAATVATVAIATEKELTADCESKGGTFTNNQCTFPIVTAATN